MAIVIDLAKAKNIGHELRRNARAVEFAPLDEKIAKQLPGVDVAAVEADRQAIRDKYAAIQSNIDAATTPQEIKDALGI